MQRTSRILLATASALLISLAAGCGGGTDGTAPASSSLAQGTSESTAPLTKESFVSGLLTAIDAHSTVHLSVDTGGSDTGEADVRYGGGETLIGVEANSELRGPSRFVITKGAVFVEQTQGGMWSKIDGNDPSYGELIKTFTEIGPRDSVAGIGAGITSVFRDGKREVDGRELTVYRLEVDPTKAQGAFKALAGTSGISETVVFDFFVDSDNLLRLVETVSAGQKATVALTGWDEPVTIDLPATNQVITY